MGMRDIYALRYTFNIGESFTVPWGINSLLLLYVRKISANTFIVCYENITKIMLEIVEENYC